MTCPIEHLPTDMTVTSGASLTVAALQAELAKGGQWLPIDPPAPGTLTIANLLAHNLSGPRRCGYGTVRDYVLGLKVILADGRSIKTGGKVVKNVAGYDLTKLFIGAGHSLGSISEVTFKLRPLPAMERFVQKRFATLVEADAAVTAVWNSALTPVVMDLHNVNTNNFHVILGFDGHAEEVEWQLAQARELGFSETASLDYEELFWAREADSIHKVSVLPSKLIETIAASGDGTFVARAGNGILYCHGEPRRLAEDLPIHLFQRARELFDPKNLLAPLPS